MGRSERGMHPNFIEYQKFIVGHENYRTLPNKFNSNGDITWVRIKDAERRLWWDNLKVQMKLPDRASVAREIHPKELNNEKPCQVCGRTLSIQYDYLNSTNFKRIANKIQVPIESQYEFKITEILNIIEKDKLIDVKHELETILGVPKLEYAKLVRREYRLKNQVLSPGVMSNAPDRLDGFHTYNACCRKTQDTGRHTSNLARYSQDRRAYENWADGDWKGANRLMGKFAENTLETQCPKCKQKNKMTADHIGPISLGFAHRMKFNPLCNSCNSAKNNRLTYDDVESLLADEAAGQAVVSWHTKPLWDSLKHEISNDAEAIELSAIMRKNLHYILLILSSIEKAGFAEYCIKFLHPEYANFEWNFENFNPKTGSFLAKKTPIDNLNSKRNAERYIRISLESLTSYDEKINRQNIKWDDLDVDDSLRALIKELNQGKEQQADKSLDKVINGLARLGTLQFKDFKNS
jgi:Alw26I/Eco31I/Esp3I family type II restriction endonuclease